MLTVLTVAYPFAPVRSDAVGGAEQIAGILDAGIVSAGHTSIVAACEGSCTVGELFTGCRPPMERLEETTSRRFRTKFQEAINRALATRTVDLIHMHGLDFHEYSLPEGIPIIVTLHLPLNWYPAKIWYGNRDRIHFCCVSDSQRGMAPEHAGPIKLVPNGVAIPSFNEIDFRLAPYDFVVAMGRICPEKNVHEAMQAATLARTPLLLAGRVYPYPEHIDYFERKIKPGLGLWVGPGHQLLEPLSCASRSRLLSRAKCLLHPTLAPETSSLVAMEALAAGCPVIAYRSGALTEIVEHGVTGFLVDSVDEMAAAIRDVDKISRAACRARAEQCFGKDRMIGAYLNLYESALQHTEETQKVAL
jgi:glycosyltransferase involved in cell wall biosynthesis